jgi:hypothetical protein
MTHDQSVAALQCAYQLNAARKSRRVFYPMRKPVPRTTLRGMGTARQPTANRTRPGSDKAASSEAMTRADARVHANARSEPERARAGDNSRLERMPSFVNTLPRCHSTVRGLRNSRAAISGFDRP